MIDERDKRILYAVVESYIHNPDPVGSRFITKHYGFSFSSATIRNIMSDLEEMGFLSQPHTSAGRVPTDKGYRFYVNALSKGDGASETRLFVQEVTRELESIRNDLHELLGETTKLLSTFSHYLSVAVSPKAKTATFNRINILKHRENTLVTILFTNEGLVNNRVVDVDFELSQRELNSIASYLNSEFYGYTLEEIRARIIRDMAREKELCDILISRAIRICREALSFSQHDIFISGLSGVLDLPDFDDVQHIREISKAIEDKHMIVKLLDKISAAEGVQVVIGSESSVVEMRKFSIVATTYKQGDKPVGAVGIIGPRRMDYSKSIAIVDAAARLITRVLSGK